MLGLEGMLPTPDSEAPWFPSQDTELLDLRETIDFLKKKNSEAQAVIQGALNASEATPKGRPSGHRARGRGVIAGFARCPGRQSHIRFLGGEGPFMVKEERPELTPTKARAQEPSKTVVKMALDSYKLKVPCRRPSSHAPGCLPKGAEMSHPRKNLDMDFFFFGFLSFLGPLPRPMEVPRLGV